MADPEPGQQEVAGVAEVQITAGGWSQPAAPVSGFRAVRRELESDHGLLEAVVGAAL
jgi:hypothetical protein